MPSPALKSESTSVDRSMANQTFVTLSSGAVCPQFGLGTYNPGGKGMDEAVEHAIKVGYRCKINAIFL